MYTIKQVAEKMGESEHTIRYYAKEGLFPFLKRDKNRVRLFSEEDLEGVSIVLCLRDTGMPLQEIKRYMELCKQGSETVAERLEIMRRQKKAVLKQLADFKKKIDHLEQKERYYEGLLHSSGEDMCNPLKIPAKDGIVTD